MIEIKTIISTFTKDESLAFTTYLSKKNKRKDTKNITLFKLLLQKELTPKDIQLKLYNGLNPDAYHALRKRLFNAIIDFISNNALKEENSIDIYIIKLILAARTLLYKKQYKTAFKILSKAETIAKKHVLFPILNEILHTQIQYAHTVSAIDLELLIKKFEDNQKQFHIEEQLNLVYAKIKNAQTKMIYQGNVVNFESLVETTLKAHNIKLSDAYTFKSMFQLMSIIDSSSFITKQYYKAEAFLINTYQSIKNHPNVDKQLYYHVGVLYIIANTLFRNKKFKKSLEYLQLMKLKC